jgi:hypothetical protein
MCRERPRRILARRLPLDRPAAARRRSAANPHRPGAVAGRGVLANTITPPGQRSRMSDTAVLFLDLVTPRSVAADLGVTEPELWQMAAAASSPARPWSLWAGSTGSRVS